MQEYYDFPTHKCLIEVPVDPVKNAIPGKGIMIEIRRYFRRITLVTEELPIVKNILKSHRAMKLERRRHMNFAYYTIHPFSKFRLRWEASLAILIAFKLIIAPFIISFYPVSRFSIVWNWPMILVFIADLIGLVDIGLSFISGYLNEMTKEIILTKSIIVRKYLKTRFIFDLLSSIPLELVLHIPGYYKNDDSFPFSPFTFLLFCKSFGLVTFLCYMHRVQRLQANLTYARKLLFHLIILLIIFHWCTCCRYLVIKFKYGENVNNIPGGSWIFRTTIFEYGVASRYIFCFYSTVSVILHFIYIPNMGEILEDRIFCLVMMLFGYVVKFAVTAQIIIVIRNTNASKLKYESVLSQLKEFLLYKQLTSRMQKRLLDYYEFNFQNFYYKETAVSNSLSPLLKQEILLCVCKRLVVNVPFFSNLPKNLLIDIVKVLGAEIYLPKDRIFQAGEIGHCMYFMGSGTVAVYGADGKEEFHLQDGAHFGEECLVSEKPRLITVVSIETCEVYTLSRTNFLQVMKPHPVLFEKIKEAALIRSTAALFARKWISFKNYDKMKDRLRKDDD